MSTDEKHSTLQEASGQQGVTEPSNSDFLAWFDHSEIQNLHDAPRRKRRKRFLKADKDCSHASQHGEVYPNYDVHSDFDDVFTTDPGIREPTKEVVKHSWIMLNSPFSQHTSRGIDTQNGCLGLTPVSDSPVGQLISDMQSFTFKGSMKRFASQRPKRKKRASWRLFGKRAIVTIQRNLDLTKCQEMEKFVRYNEVWLFRPFGFPRWRRGGVGKELIPV